MKITIVQGLSSIDLDFTSLLGSADVIYFMRDNPNVTFVVNPQARPVVPAAASSAAEPKVRLYWYGSYGRQYTQKISAIKLLRELSGLGLSESKAFVEQSRGSFEVPKSRADEIIRKFDDYGYAVETC